MWSLSRYFLGGGKPLNSVQDARRNNIRSLRYPYLEFGAAAALEADVTLGDIADRLQPFGMYDDDVFQAFLQSAGAMAEFKIQCEEESEYKLRRGRLKLFHEHMTAMQTQLRFLRRKIFEKNASALEDFDAIAKEELGKYAKDEHHNLWCESSL
jgi:hypothetical protein